MKAGKPAAVGRKLGVAELETRAAQLQEMAADPSLVSGIHNYCDRWCERCPQTARCLSFRVEQAQRRESPDGGNESSPEAFWEALSENLALTLHLLRQEAEQRGIELNEGEMAADIERQARERGERRNSPLLRTAAHYTRAANLCLKEVEAALPGLEADLHREANLGVGSPGQTVATLTEALDVIGWYHHFIEVKLSRAEFGRRHEEEDELNSGDTNGSAKVALIAIDRSLAAWTRVRTILAGLADPILRVLVQLERLRATVEENFPHARAFKRPGFD